MEIISADVAFELPMCIHPHKGPLITLIVGDPVARKPYLFKVHKMFLVRKSLYFRNELTGPPAKESLRAITFDHELCEREVFFDVAHWAYGGWNRGGSSEYHLDSKTEHDLQKRLDADTPSMPHLIKLWLLAELLGVSAFQNFVISKIWEKMDRVGCDFPDQLKFVYDKTNGDSPLRALFVDRFFFHFADPSYIKKNPDVVPQQFLVDFFIRAQQHNLYGDKKDFDPTTYYVDEKDDQPIIPFWLC